MHVSGGGLGACVGAAGLGGASVLLVPSRPWVSDRGLAIAPGASANDPSARIRPKTTNAARIRWVVDILMPPADGPPSWRRSTDDLSAARRAPSLGRHTPVASHRTLFFPGGKSGGVGRSRPTAADRVSMRADSDAGPIRSRSDRLASGLGVGARGLHGGMGAG